MQFKRAEKTKSFHILSSSVITSFNVVYSRITDSVFKWVINKSNNTEVFGEKLVVEIHVEKTLTMLHEAASVLNHVSVCTGLSYTSGAYDELGYWQATHHVLKKRKNRDTNETSQ
jgi:hypothetical protein